jgi:hypothetical protein
MCEFYNFWPKNDGEKWSRKNIFEIPKSILFLFILLHRKEDFTAKLPIQ